MAERTEPATPRRLRLARERGQIARSEELVAGVLLCGGGLALDWLGPPTLGALSAMNAPGLST